MIDAQKRETNKLFNWTPYGTVTRLDDPDRIFSTEIIFGIYNQSLYTFFNNWFAGGLKTDKELCPNKARLVEVYDDEKDYRYTSTWKAPENTSKDYLTCFKYARPSNVADYDTVYSYIQPMIRITEMYYIAAECSDDMELLKTVRRERNMTADMLGDLRTELTKEYSKEFWAEGQLFFYYKRINASSIPNGNAISGDVSLNSSKYMIPLPKSELDLR